MMDPKEAHMGTEQEKAALRELRAETERLSDLAKSFYHAVTTDPEIKAKSGRFKVPTVLKPVGT